MEQVEILTQKRTELVKQSNTLAEQLNQVQLQVKMVEKEMFDLLSQTTQSAYSGLVIVDNDKKFTAKKAVLKIIDDNPIGVTLNQVVENLHKMRNEGSFQTKAKEMTAIAAQAINKLKDDGTIYADRIEGVRHSVYKRA